MKKPIILEGIVIAGKNRGKKLGFPTANIILTKNVVPGVYISKTKIKDTLYPSLTFVGASETFNEKEIRVETYILDFDQNVYNESITFYLLKKIRDSIQFHTVEELKIQMKKDEQMARKYFRI